MHGPRGLYIWVLIGTKEAAAPWATYLGVRRAFLRPFLGLRDLLMVSRPQQGQALPTPVYTISTSLERVSEPLPSGNFRPLLRPTTWLRFLVIRLPHGHGWCAQYPLRCNNKSIIASQNVCTFLLTPGIYRSKILTVLLALVMSFCHNSN